MIYKIRSDRNHFMNAYISPDEVESVLGDYFLLDEPKWSPFWKPLQVSFSDDSDAGDIVSIPEVTVWGTTVNLICSEVAKRKLEPHISLFGEWLPVVCEGINYFLFHPTNTLPIEAIDVAQSERTIDAMDYIEASKITVYPNILKENWLFTTEYDNQLNLYANSLFHSFLSVQGLTGLRLCEQVSSAP